MKSLDELRNELLALQAVDEAQMEKDCIRKEREVEQAQEDLDFAESEYSKSDGLLELHRGNIARARLMLEKAEDLAAAELKGGGG